MPSIIFICTGNTCRSPLAEVIFKDILIKQGVDINNWRVESAGTWANDGDPAMPFTQATAASRGLTLSDHVARTVNEEMLASFDLILTMTANHREALLAEFPHLKRKVRMLSQMSGTHRDVADPIGGDAGDYESAALEITRLLERGLPRILSLLAPKD